MAHPRPSIVALFSLGLAFGACTDPASPGPIEVVVTATDSGSGGAESSGEESGEPGEPSPVEGRCLFDDDDAEAQNVFGYRYQCRGLLEVTVEFDGSSEPLVVEYGPAIEGDSYAEPKVMACCSPVGVDAACEEPHGQACVVDAIAQGCRSLSVRLEAFAQGLGPAAKEAALKAADYIATHVQDCFDTFAVETAITMTPPGCDANQNSDPNFADLAIGAAWSFDPPGILDDVTITITDARHDGIFPWTTDPEYPGEVCLSSQFNDHVVLNELPPGLGPDDFVTLYHGQVEVRGPSVIEAASLASTRTQCSTDCSRVRIVEHPGGTATLVRMLGRGDAPTTIGTIAVDAFRAELIGEVVAAGVSPGVYEIPPDAAVFAISGQALGSSALVGVKNPKAIRFRRGRTVGSWDIDPFQLSYADERNDVYDFFVGATRWQ